MANSLTRNFASCSLATFVIALSSAASFVAAQDQCIPSNPEINEFFETDNPTCCQFDVCGIPCPAPVSEPTKGFAITVGVTVLVSFIVGIGSVLMIKGKAVNFFIAGKSLPLWMVAVTLSAQSIDSNALLGNATLSYKYQFFDGAVLPIGLGLSLLLNGIFLAPHINMEERVLTLPDVLAKRYGKIVEVLCSCASIISFIMLLAGNLVGTGVILSYTWGLTTAQGIWIGCLIVWGYTVSGGLFSIAYTDLVQVSVGWSGAAAFVYYTLMNDVRAPPASIGFPGYIYPDNIGDGGICDMYEGVACQYEPTKCCYNAELWCPTPDNCRSDNGAYPIGDKGVFGNQMGYFLALSPFPNAIFWNWATILILGIGNLAALDFQARCMAAKTPSGARWGCIIGALSTFIIAVPFAAMGGTTRVYYGPDSIHAEFDADTCNTLLGLPTCGAWVPDPDAFVKYLTHQAPAFLGAWCMLGIIAASMSTASGAILAMGTVFSHNVVRQFDSIFPWLVTPENLLTVTRLATGPLAVCSALIAAYYQSDNPAGSTGYLLIVAFDVVLATVVVPLFGCFYAKNPRPTAALVSMICGATTRIILEFTLPKDGYLLLPYKVPEFLNYGPAASTKLPLFVDGNVTQVWDPSVEVCDQDRYKDFTGVDSLTAFLVSFLVYTSIQYLENKRDTPLFTLSGMQGYEKDLGQEAIAEGKEVETGLPVDDTVLRDDTMNESGSGSKLVESGEPAEQAMPSEEYVVDA